MQSFRATSSDLVSKLQMIQLQLDDIIILYPNRMVSLVQSQLCYISLLLVFSILNISTVKGSGTS